MDNIKLEINGYIATLRPFLNFGQKRQLEKLMAGAMSIDTQTSKPNTNIDGSIVYEAQDLTLHMMLVSLMKPDGTTLQGDAAYTAIQNLEPQDEEVGKAIYAKLDEITGGNVLSAEDKKKLNSTPSNSTTEAAA